MWQARAASEGASSSRQAGYLKAAAEGAMAQASTVRAGCPAGGALHAGEPATPDLAR